MNIGVKRVSIADSAQVAVRQKIFFLKIFPPATKIKVQIS